MNTERETGPVPIPRAIFAGLEAVRLSGLVNMVGARDVAFVAREMGRDDVADWIEENRALYARRVLRVRRDGVAALPLPATTRGRQAVMPWTTGAFLARPVTMRS